MNFLPTAIRELQVAARRRSTYFWRTLSAAMAASVTLGCLLAGFSGAVSAGSAGQFTVALLSVIGYVFAAVAAGLITADCISEERRDGTLGLLFLTDLSGYDVVLGKLARLADPVYSMMAAFPALGLTMLLGGVSPGDFAMIALSLLNTLFFFAGMGLLLSALSGDGRGAVSAAMLGVVIFSAGPAAALAGLHFSSPWTALLLPTPAGAFASALASTHPTVSTPNFFWSLIVSHALGWLFIAAASRAVARNFSVPPAQPVARVKSIAGANPAMALQLRGTEWRLCRPVFLLAALAALVVAAAMLISPSDWYDIPTFLGIVFGLHEILKFWTASRACNSLPSRRRSGELEILLTTPLDGDDIVLGSTTAIKHQLLRPFLFVAGMDVLLLVLGWHKLGIWDGFPYAGVMLVEFLWLIGNLYSLTWVGLWMGLKTSNHAKALGRTLFYILCLPWLGMAVAAAFVGVLTMGKTLSPWMGALTVPGFFMTLAVCNLGFTGWAISELRDSFRLLAASQSLAPDRFAPQWKVFFKLRLFSWPPRNASHGG